jgi:hypothetical protein
MQQTADLLDGLGFNAPNDDPFSPNAAILRSAEAVDAVLNSARSGYAETKRESGGMILCSMVQLGGIIYVGFLLIIVFVLTSCLPLLNLFTRTLFDLTVAACTASTSGKGRKKAGKGLAGAIQAQVQSQIKKAMAGTAGGAPRMPTGAAVANGSGAAWGGAVGNVRVTGTDSDGNAIYSASDNDARNHHNHPEIAATKMRRVLKKHRATRKTPPAAPKPVITAVASLVKDARGFGQRIFGTRGEEQDSLIDKGNLNDGSAYI